MSEFRFDKIWGSRVGWSSEPREETKVCLGTAIGSHGPNPSAAVSHCQYHNLFSSLFSTVGPSENEILLLIWGSSCFRGILLLAVFVQLQHFLFVLCMHEWRKSRST